jgi:hypothetical protein
MAFVGRIACKSLELLVIMITMVGIVESPAHPLGIDSRVRDLGPWMFCRVCSRDPQLSFLFVGSQRRATAEECFGAFSAIIIAMASWRKSMGNVRRPAISIRANIIDQHGYPMGRAIFHKTTIEIPRCKGAIDWTGGHNGQFPFSLDFLRSLCRECMENITL